MMQVSTLYAHSLERQLVARRSQKLIQNLSKNCSSNKSSPASSEDDLLASSSSLDYSSDELEVHSDGDFITTDITRSVSCPAGSSEAFNLINSGDNRPLGPESKEFTDRLCKLPTQCRGGHILGSPRRSMSATLPRTGKTSEGNNNNNMTISSHIVKAQFARRNSLDPSKKLSLEKSKVVMDSGLLNLTINDKKTTKNKKDPKRIPSNFMFLGTWTTRLHSEKLLDQVKSGDVLEFNIKFHHHWGIAVLPKNKKSNLTNLELVHLKQDKEGRQRAVKETLGSYWVEGVTARINNQRDVHKPPLPANDVVSTSLKLTTQPYRVWPNSEVLIAYCRYGERMRNRQMSDAARFGTLSKCVGLWLSLTSRHTSPSTSPAIGRKRTFSVNF